MLEIFDQYTKLRFKNPLHPAYVQFGRTRDNDHALGIFAGELKLDGQVIQIFGGQSTLNLKIGKRLPGSLNHLFLKSSKPSTINDLLPRKIFRSVSVSRSVSAAKPSKGCFSCRWLR